MNDARSSIEMGDNVTGLRLALDDPSSRPISSSRSRIDRHRRAGFYVSDWTRDMRSSSAPS